MCFSRHSGLRLSPFFFALSLTSHSLFFQFLLDFKLFASIFLNLFLFQVYCVIYLLVLSTVPFQFFPPLVLSFVVICVNLFILLENFWQCNIHSVYFWQCNVHSLYVFCKRKKIWEVYNQRNPLFLIEDCIPDWRVHLKRYGCQSVTVRGEDLQFCIYWMEISYFYYLFGYICLGGVWKSLFGLMERVYDTVNSFNLISK